MGPSRRRQVLLALAAVVALTACSAPAPEPPTFDVVGRQRTDSALEETTMVQAVRSAELAIAMAHATGDLTAPAIAESWEEQPASGYLHRIVQRSAAGDVPPPGPPSSMPLHVFVRDHALAIDGVEPIVLDEHGRLDIEGQPWPVPEGTDAVVVMCSTYSSDLYGPFRTMSPFLYGLGSDDSGGWRVSVTTRTALTLPACSDAVGGDARFEPEPSEPPTIIQGPEED